MSDMRLSCREIPTTNDHLKGTLHIQSYHGAGPCEQRSND